MAEQLIALWIDKYVLDFKNSFHRSLPCEGNHHYVHPRRLVVTGSRTCLRYMDDLLEFYYNEAIKCNMVESKVILRTHFKKTLATQSLLKKKKNIETEE